MANLAERQRAAGQPHGALALLSYGALALLYGLMLLAGLLLQLAGSLPPETFAAAPGLSADVVASLPAVGLGFWLPSLVGLALLTPPARRLAARLLPLDAANPVHAIALAFVPLIFINLLVILGLGLGNLADALQEDPAAVRNPAPGLWMQAAALVALAFVGVGWLARRTLAAAAQRLGIVALAARDVALGAASGAGLAVLVIGLTALTAAIGIGFDADVERLTETMIGPLTQSVFGLLTLGLAAALGEESVFRGALQPRFGLLFTSILFALLHSNYGLSLSTVIVLVVGLALGLLRQQRNTTTAMVAHAVYNICLGLLAALGM